MSVKKHKKNEDELWGIISTNFVTKSPFDEYEKEIQWLIMNMCNITTQLYKTHKQPIPACHQSAHYIYLGVSIFKILRGNPNFIRRRITSQKKYLKNFCLMLFMKTKNTFFYWQIVISKCHIDGFIYVPKN